MVSAQSSTWRYRGCYGKCGGIMKAVVVSIRLKSVYTGLYVMYKDVHLTLHRLQKCNGKYVTPQVVQG